MTASEVRRLYRREYRLMELEVLPVRLIVGAVYIVVAPAILLARLAEFVNERFVHDTLLAKHYCRVNRLYHVRRKQYLRALERECSGTNTRHE